MPAEVWPSLTSVAVASSISVVLGRCERYLEGGFKFGRFGKSSKGTILGLSPVEVWEAGRAGEAGQGLQWAQLPSVIGAARTATIWLLFPECLVCAGHDIYDFQCSQLHMVGVLSPVF